MPSPDRSPIPARTGIIDTIIPVPKVCSTTIKLPVITLLNSTCAPAARLPAATPDATSPKVVRPMIAAPILAVSVIGPFDEDVI